MAPPDGEVPLEGGVANRGLVVRVGDTVRRPLRPTSPATHALLAYLAEVGFDGAPRLLGIDEHGREVLSYIDGDAVTTPYPAWAMTESALVSVAQLLRRYHEAVRDFDSAGHRWPPSPPAPYAGDLISHNDPNVNNVIFRDGRAVALIDYDLSSPGSPLWDLAAACRLWAPLRPAGDTDPQRRGQALARFRTMVEAYGIEESEHQLLVDAIGLNHDWLYAIVRSEAQDGNTGFADYWTDAAQRVGRTRTWIGEHRQLLVDVLRSEEVTER